MKIWIKAIPVLLGLIFVFLLPVKAQEEKIDSLEQLLKGATGRQKIDLALEIAEAHRRISSKTALEKASETLSEAQQLGYRKGEARAYLILCDASNDQGDYDQANTYCNQSREIYEQLNDKVGLSLALRGFGSIELNLGNYPNARQFYFRSVAIIKKTDNYDDLAQLYHHIGISYFHESRYDSSLFYHRKNLEISKKYGYREKEADALYCIGVNYEGMDDYEKSLDFVLQSLRIREEIGDEHGMAQILNSLGLIHTNSGNLDKGLEYHLKSLELYEAQGRKRGASIVLNNIGVIYFDKGDFEKALEYYQRCLAVSREMEFKPGEGYALSNIAEVYQELKNYDSAIIYNKRSLQIRTEAGATELMAKSNRNLGNLYAEMGNYSMAEEHLNKAIALSKQDNSFGGLRSGHFALSALYEKRGKYKESLAALREAEAFEDSIVNEDKIKAQAELQTRYETEKKEQQLALLNKQKEVETLWRYVLLGAVIAIVILGFIIYRYQLFRTAQHKRRYEEELKVSQKLQELDSMKSRFFANISHEFRTPLTLIKGPVDKLLETADKETRTTLSMINRNTGKLLKLVNQLLDLSKIEAGKLELKTAPLPIVPFLRRIVMLFSSQAERKHIRLDFTCEDDDIIVYFDAEKLEQIVENLLSNALKWTPEKGKIHVTAERTELNGLKYFQVTVKDNGPGISGESLPYIFDRFYQSSGTEQVEGTGIGLSLAKELAELHHGKITVESVPKVGSAFKVLLPLGKEHLKEEEINLFATNKTPSQIPEEGLAPIQAEDPDEALAEFKVLVVDDNEDIRAYIKQILGNRFLIEEAVDGSEAWDNILNIIPDLVLSDVMMPKLNGFQLCQKIKTDNRTSHIPVILLTAKASEEEKVEGLQYEANDYLMKPFNARELVLKIENMLTIRRRIQAQFSSPNFNPKEVNLSSLDETFVNKLMQILEDRHSDERFGIVEMAGEIGMSRTHLHRKVQSLTGQAPSQLLRKFRLEKALMMLKKNTGTVSEISYAVGFASPSYFSKCFSDEFGYSPKEIKQ